LQVHGKSEIFKDTPDLSHEIPDGGVRPEPRGSPPMACAVSHAEFPQKLRLSLVRLVEMLGDELGTTRMDFAEIETRRSL
jgi:hypothetical protein